MRSPETILAEARTVAVVGSSPKPERPSRIAENAALDYVENACTPVVHRLDLAR